MLSLGSSGNPTGRPKGSYDKRAELRELLKPHADDSVEKAVDPALGGDTVAQSRVLIGSCRRCSQGPISVHMDIVRILLSAPLLALRLNLSEIS